MCGLVVRKNRALGGMQWGRGGYGVIRDPLLGRVVVAMDHPQINDPWTTDCIEKNRE